MEAKEYFKELEKLRRRRALVLLLTFRWDSRKLLLRKGKYIGQQWRHRSEELWTPQMRELDEEYRSSSAPAAT